MSVLGVPGRDDDPPGVNGRHGMAIGALHAPYEVPEGRDPGSSGGTMTVGVYLGAVK
jgi:hypothetical protein